MAESQKYQRSYSVASIPTASSTRKQTTSVDPWAAFPDAPAAQVDLWDQFPDAPSGRPVTDPELLRQLETVDIPVGQQARNGWRVTVAGLILVRQKPGTARGVTFMTIEDETDVANIVIWADLFERQRRLILTNGMLGYRGRVQREGRVIHVVAEHFLDYSDLLRSVGQRDGSFPLPYGRGDEARTGGGPDLRGSVRVRPQGTAAGEQAASAEILIKSRDFR